MAVVDPVHSMTLGDVLRELRRSFPQQTATVCGRDRFTFPELDDRTNRLAHALRAEGVAPGDRVLWLGQNCHRVLEGLLAAAKIGAVFCPVNWRQSADELAWTVGDCDPTVVIWQEAEIGDTVRAARVRADGDRVWIRHDDPSGDGYESFLGGTADDPDLVVDPQAPVLMLYTGAFAGRPNGAQLSHLSIIVQDLVVGMLQEVGSDDVYLNCGPLFHVATLMTTMATFHFGGTNVFTPRVDAEELCRLIEAERCTGAFIIGPTVDEILEVNADGKYDLRSLRTFGGKRAWNEMITVDTSPWATRPGGYGQTECMGMLTFSALGGAAQGSAGRPSPVVQIRVVDPHGNEVAPGETGEIVARGLTVGNGYFARDETSSQRLRDGWWHTNDLGRRELDGSLTFVAPKARMIKSAAENIYPAEVEQTIAEHPDVHQCAVIGVPDRRWHQSVKAIVVPKRGSSPTEDDIIEFVRSRIASYKKPRSVEFVEGLPRDGWQVDYAALDERFGGGNYPTSSSRSV